MFTVPTVGAENTIVIPLVNAKTDAGVGITASASGTAFGITNTTGTLQNLVSANAATSTVTSKALFQIPLPPTYTGQLSLKLTVNANFNLTTTASLSTKTIAAAAYFISPLGVSSTNSVTTTPIIMASTATDEVFTIPAGTTFTPLSSLVIEATTVIVETAGANATAQINSIRVG